MVVVQVKECVNVPLHLSVFSFHPEFLLSPRPKPDPTTLTRINGLRAQNEDRWSPYFPMCTHLFASCSGISQALLHRNTISVSLSSAECGSMAFSGLIDFQTQLFIWQLIFSFFMIY